MYSVRFTTCEIVTRDLQIKNKQSTKLKGAYNFWIVYFFYQNAMHERRNKIWSRAIKVQESRQSRAFRLGAMKIIHQRFSTFSLCWLTQRGWAIYLKSTNRASGLFSNYSSLYIYFWYLIRFINLFHVMITIAHFIFPSNFTIFALFDRILLFVTKWGQKYWNLPNSQCIFWEIYLLVFCDK